MVELVLTRAQLDSAPCLQLEAEVQIPGDPPSDTALSLPAVLLAPANSHPLPYPGSVNTALDAAKGPAVTRQENASSLV